MKKVISDTFCRFLILSMVVFLPFTLYGQDGMITGKVTEPDGEALVGASVVVKGTARGDITNASGEFSISANPGETLMVSFLGYGSIEMPVTTASVYNIVIEPEAEFIDDVIVVGYGAVKKSDLTGSVGSVNMEAIADIPARTIDGLLQGRVAGVQVLNSSQDPGAGSTVRIRGNSSLRGSNTPLIVVNGFPMGEAGDLSQINVSDIESVEVLKDASAAAIYGSRGANGVILVTTKTAKAGVTTVSVKHNTVISQFSDKLNIWYDPLLMAQVANEENINAGLNPPYIGQTVNGIYYPSLIEIQNGEWSNTDWRKLTLRTPIVNTTTASVNSANDKASFNLNVNYYDDQGAYKNDSYNKVNANMGITYKPFKNFTISTYNVLSIYNRKVSNGLEYGRNPLWPVYNPDGSLFLAGDQDYGHPLLRLNDVMNKLSGRDFVTSLGIDWELVPGLTLHSQVDYQYMTSVNDVYRASTTSSDAESNGGIAQINIPVSQNLLSETYLTYNKEFNKDHVLTVMAGHAYNFDEGRGLYTTARGFINDVLGNENMDAGKPEMRQIYNNGYYKTKLLSFYGRINYSLMDKYLFTVTMRADGSSKFGLNNKWGYYPSGAVSWKMHNEEWLKDVRWLSELKLRASFGVSGNQGISPYQTLDRYGNEKFWSGGVWNTAVGPGYEVGRTGANNRYMMWGGIASPNLKWESTSQWNVGVDAAFFNRRLRVTADTYYKRTYDLLRERFLTVSSGYDKIWVNDGEVLNRGFEISVDGDIISTEDWTFSAGLMYSMNRNKITSLGDAISSGLSTDFLTGMKYEVTNEPIAMFNQNVNIFAIGQPMNVFYGYRVDGIIQLEEDPGFLDPTGIRDRPGELKYVDLNDDYLIDDKDRTIIGDPNPDFIASLTLSARWKNLDMSIFFYSMVGHDVLYNNYTFDPRVKANRWTVDNPTNDFPRLNNNRQYMLSDYFIQDGSFLRIQNVNVGYNIELPNSFLKKIRVYANLENLFTFTKFDGYDPEVGLDGIYWGGFPKFRKYSIGVDFNF